MKEQDKPCLEDFTKFNLVLMKQESSSEVSCKRLFWCFAITTVKPRTCVKEHKDLANYKVYICSKRKITNESKLKDYHASTSKSFYTEII